MKLGTAQIIQGNALNLPLPDSSVDLVCTSPPYFGLRSYQDAGMHYDGQIGSEATPAEFLEALLAATREMVRVLKPTGSIFVNLGDKYAGGGGGPQGGYLTGTKHKIGTPRPRDYGIPAKSLMGIPWRYALQCIDQLGLILRAEIIWAKPNGLPESVTDRVRRSHEQWFHFTKQPRYFSAVDEIRKPHTVDISGWKVGSQSNSAQGDINRPRAHDTAGVSSAVGQHPLGKLPGSVWEVATQPLTVPPELGVDHFAAYPMEWPRRIIMGWTPNGICTQCGEGRRPVGEVAPESYSGPLVEVRKSEPSADTLEAISAYIKAARQSSERTNSFDVTEEVTGKRTGACANWEKGLSLPEPEHWRKLKVALKMGSEWDHVMLDTYMRPSGNLKSGPPLISGRHQTSGSTGLTKLTTITGYVCGCPTPTAPTRPSVVCDPFGGTGTTALVAKALGRTGITIDLSRDYCRLAQWRCNDPRELAAALQVEKPDPVHPDQLDLFSGIE